MGQRGQKQAEGLVVFFFFHRGIGCALSERGAGGEGVTVHHRRAESPPSPPPADSSCRVETIQRGPPNTAAAKNPAQKLKEMRKEIVSAKFLWFCRLYWFTAVKGGQAKLVAVTAGHRSRQLSQRKGSGRTERSSPPALRTQAERRNPSPIIPVLTSVIKFIARTGAPDPSPAITSSVGRRVCGGKGGKL